MAFRNVLEASGGIRAIWVIKCRQRRTKLLEAIWVKVGSLVRVRVFCASRTFSNALKHVLWFGLTL